MNYGTEVKEIIEKELETLINMVKERKVKMKGGTKDGFIVYCTSLIQ